MTLFLLIHELSWVASIILPNFMLLMYRKK